MLQTAAATAMIVSLLTPHQVVVYNGGYASNDGHTHRTQWSVMPGAAGATAGATLSVTDF